MKLTLTGVTLMDKKILASMLIIAAASMLIGAGTVAYFSDTETSSGNVFQAGTGPDLKLSHSSGGPWTDGVTGTWTLADMKPGNETEEASVFFKNFGSPSSTMTITCDYNVDEETNPVESDTDPHTDQHPDELAKYMVITYICYRDDQININCLTGEDDGYPPNENWRVNDTDLDERITLYDLKMDPLVNLPSPDTQQNGITQLDMRIKFDENAGNDFQGDIFDLTMIFTLNQ
jgi:predicted ribosomally synthesized peptide with SipW-like signal peptide